MADAVRCREVTGCQDLMIGRGMINNPGLALEIKFHDAQAQGLSVADMPKSFSWAQLWPQSAHLLQEECEAWLKTNWQFKFQISSGV